MDRVEEIRIEWTRKSLVDILVADKIDLANEAKYDIDTLLAALDAANNRIGQIAYDSQIAIDTLNSECDVAQARIKELEGILYDLAACFDGHTIEVREVRTWEGVDPIDGDVSCTHSFVTESRGTVRRHVRNTLDRIRVLLKLDSEVKSNE